MKKQKLSASKYTLPISSNGYHEDMVYGEEDCTRACMLECICSCNDLLSRLSNPRLRRLVVLGLGFLSLSLGLFLIIYPAPDLSAEQDILSRIAELDERLKHSNALNDQRKSELQEISQDFTELLNLVKQHQDQYEDNNSALNQKLHQYEDKGFFAGNMSGRFDLTVPGLAAFLPNTLRSSRALQPAIKISRDRNHVSMVIGIPTVKREFQSYLVPTLQSVFDNMNEEEMKDTLVIVFIAETDPEAVYQVSSEIQAHFSKHFDSGLLEVVSPPPEFYPEMSSLKQTLGDEMERVVWRSKQALDFSFLMMYAQAKGTYYVQLEDDVLTKKGYIGIMKKFALEKTAAKQNWFVIDFCQLGFIGKMFRSTDLPWLVQFFLMFYNDKPVDWLLVNILQTKVCKLDQDNKKCKKEEEKLWIHYKPSLFQHIGTHSSLKGKVQKLKDRQFGRVQLFTPHKNPPAKIESPIKHYKHYSIERAYKGDTFFWGLVPQPGDQIIFQFQPPLVLESFKFVTGNLEHPSDRFVNTTCEIKLVRSSPPLDKYPRTTDDYLILGGFDKFGIAEGTLGAELGLVEIFRLNIHSASENWAILSEIMFTAS